ncbi:MAG TPA: hypothetical protein VLM89_07585 [Phycisphaerae bacterium]|nr:hypothetical protein [Phycisphaerae bacterium]
MGSSDAGVLLTDRVTQTLKAHGFAVAALKGVSADNLKAIDGARGVYGLLLTARPGFDNQNEMSRVLLYLRTTDRGLVLAEPPEIMVRTPDELREVWRDGYLLLTSLDHERLGAVVKAVRQSPGRPGKFGLWIWGVLAAFAAVFVVVTVKHLFGSAGTRGAGHGQASYR